MAYLTTGSVKAGSYVVIDKEELVTNGTFDSDTDWTKQTGWVISGGVASNGSAGQAIYQTPTSYTVGQQYTIKFKISSYTSGLVGWYISGGLTPTASISGVGTYSFNFTATSTSHLTGVIVNSGSNFVGSIDNVSVQLASDVYRAKQTAPALTSLTNTTYFEDRTQFGITNKILATMKDDGTIKTEVCFVDTDIEHCGNAHKVMTDNGYSKLSNGLYSKGTDVVTPIGTWSTLNKGAFHPVYNYFGTSLCDLGVYWWFSTGVTVASTYETFSRASVNSLYDGSVDGASLEYFGHPQGKFYDVIYDDQWIDLRIQANAISEQDELNRVGTKAKSGQLDGIGGVVATYALNDTIDSIADGSTYILLYTTDRHENNDNIYVFGDDGTMYDSYNYGARIAQNGANTSTYVYLELPNASNFTVGNSFKVYYAKTLPHPSSGTALTTDVIGDPANYPQEWKDRLASGLPLIGMNPLLVGQDGADYTSGTHTNLMLSKKAVKGIDLLYSAVPVSTWTNGGDPALNLVNNSDSLGLIENYIRLLNYTAKIPTTQVSEPKAVKLVGNYVTATNSHSVYKCNQLVPTGKVNVGNGSNGLESKVVENVGMTYEIISTLDTTAVNLIKGVTLLYFAGNRTASGFESGKYYLWNTTDFFGVWNPSTASLNILDFIVSSNIVSTPTHSTITLDNSNSPAVKFIETIAEDDDGMAHYQVFAQEMVWDYDLDQYTEAIEFTPSYSPAEGVVKGLLYKFSGFNNSQVNNRYFIAINNISQSNLNTYYTASAFDGASIINEEFINLIPGTAELHQEFKLWNGNGFGDDNQFTQLTNGTLTDDNANTVKTIVASRPLNKYIGDE